MDTPESREADPARPLKEIAEDTLPRGLLEARSEVSGCLFFFLNILFFMRRVGIVLPSSRPLVIQRPPIWVPVLQSLGSSGSG